MIPRDSHVTEPTEVRRLTGQNLAILTALQEKPRTRRELLDFALNVTGRISDLRAAKYVIHCDEKPNGLSVYTLVGSPRQGEGHDLNKGFELR